MLIWRSETHGGQTIDWFDWKIKWRWIYSALRDRWKWFDIGSLVVPLLVFLYAIVSRKLTLSRNLAFSAIVLAIAFVMLPRIVFGSAYADMRLVPYLMAVMLLAIRFRGAPDRTTAQVLAVTGAAPDHPVRIDALEGAYLKAVWLRMGEHQAPREDEAGEDEPAPAE